MSLGFGFSLPALVPYGSGGNNPFGQLGPTLDLSFTGTAGNLSGENTYTLDTNFITPQYQVAAQYAVWVDGSGMTQRNFADIVTFTRGSNATQFDSTGSLVYAPVNLLLRSESLATTAVWFNSGLTSITNNTPNTVDPAGGNTATELVVAASAGVVGQGAVLSGVNHTGSVWLRCASGTVTGSLIIYLTAAPFTNIGTQAITITTTWQRFSVTTSSLPTAGVSYNFQIHNLSGGTVYAWGAQLNPSPIFGGITSSLSTYYPTTTAAYYGPRFDYNPATLAARGLLIEEQRTNSIRNNTMQGAVAGTPGTLPTNWGTLVNTTTGLTTSVIGTGTENGVTYIDIRLNGTATGAGSWDIFFEPASGVAALTGQTWSGSLYWKLQAGSTTGLSAPTYYLYEFTSGIAFIVAQAVNLTFPTGAALNTQRQGGAMTLTGGATTAYARPLIKINIANGAAIDITLRIGLPQLELGAFATSVIPTTTTALTRSADVASVNTLAPWFNSTAGTTYFEGVTFDSLAANFPRAFQFNDGTNNNVIQITRNNGSGTARMSVVSGGVAQAAADSTAWTLNATTKSALAYAANDFAIVTNGGAATTDTSGTVPSVTNLLLGSQVGGVSQLNGYLRRITYYPRRLANADLQTITI